MSSTHYTVFGYVLYVLLDGVNTTANMIPFLYQYGFYNFIYLHLFYFKIWSSGALVGAMVGAVGAICMGYIISSE
jgi:hypothetical protein